MNLTKPPSASAPQQRRRGFTPRRRTVDYFFFEPLLLELLLLPLLLELELALFFELELEPDLVGIVLSFRRAQPLNRRCRSSVGYPTLTQCKCSRLVLLEQIGYAGCSTGGARPPMIEANGACKDEGDRGHGCAVENHR